MPQADLKLPTRPHLIEIHEEPWCPDIIRNVVVEILRRGWCLDYFWLPSSLQRSLAPCHTAAKLIGETCELCNTRNVVDLASGMGGPMFAIADDLRDRDVSITLTDLYPHPTEWTMLREGHPNVGFSTAPVDATKPITHRGMRTVMAAFHHFDPQTAISVLRSAADARQPFLAAELTEWSIVGVLLIIILTVITGILAVPVIVLSSRSLTGLIRTIPAVLLGMPILVCDGFVSCWRTYSDADWLALAHAADPKGNMRWRVDTRPASPLLPILRLRTLIGIPIEPK